MSWHSLLLIYACVYMHILLLYNNLYVDAVVVVDVLYITYAHIVAIGRLRSGFTITVTAYIHAVIPPHLRLVLILLF